MGSAETMAYISSKYQDPSVDWPDLQIFFASYSDVADGGLFSRRGAGVTYEYYSQVFEHALYRDSFAIIPLLMRPESRGKILLNSNNPMEYPIIYANYFDHPKDIDILVSCTEFKEKCCVNLICFELNIQFQCLFFLNEITNSKLNAFH